MADQFSNYSLQIFEQMNKTVANKMKTLESKEMDKTITSLLGLEDKFTQTENKLDKTINKMIMAKLNKEAIEEIDFIN
jgi:hypothetical protein